MIRSIKDTPLSELLKFMDRVKATALASDNIIQTIETMNENGLGSIVVLDANKHPIGIFTERDVLTKVANNHFENLDSTLEELMTKNPKTINENHSIHDGMKQMRFGKYRNLILVDNENKFVDLIPMQIILEFLEDEVNELVA